jgi:predicted O-methyltransferase YrrM
MQLPWREFHPGQAIQTSLTANEVAELRRLSVNEDCLDIGTAFGFSAIAMAFGARHVVSVDTHDMFKSAETFARNVAEYGLEKKITSVIGSTQQILLCLPPEHFGLIFIDADHKEGSVFHDARHAMRLVAPRGHICFHDYGEDGNPDVKKMVDRLLPGGRLIDTLYVKEVLNGVVRRHSHIDGGAPG